MKWALYNLTATTKSGGMETIVWRLGRELLERGHQAVLFGGLSERPAPEWAAGLEVRRYPFRPREEFPDLGSRARKLMERLSFARRALPDLRSGGFQRVMIFKPYDLVPVLWATRGSDARVGFYSGGTEFFPGYGLMGRRLDYVGSVSRFNAGQIHRATGLEAEANYPGVDTDHFRPTQPDPELARRVKAAPGDEVIVTAVRLVALKGVQHVISAMDLLRNSHPRLRLLVAGEGPYRQALEAKAQELGLGERVSFLGYLDQSRLAGFYALGRAAVFASTGEEALGLSPAEAMACGLPVAASRLGGVPEVVGEDAGILTPPGDAAALALALDKILGDSELRRKMAQAGKARAAELFNWSAFAQRLEQGLARGEG